MFFHVSWVRKARRMQTAAFLSFLSFFFFVFALFFFGAHPLSAQNGTNAAESPVLHEAQSGETGINRESAAVGETEGSGENTVSERPLFSTHEAETDEQTHKNSLSIANGGLRNLILAVAGITILFMILIFILKKFAPGEAPPLPKEAFEILGKTPLAFRQQLYLMRCGKKLFVVSVSQNGLDRVGEIEDEMEVARLAKLCGKPIPEMEIPEKN